MNSKALLRKIAAGLRKIIFRQTPHAIFSWRFFLPKQNPTVIKHREILLGAWPQLPRSAWFLIAIYSFSLWYIFFAWISIARAWIRRSAKLSRLGGPSRHIQLCQLLQLTLLHSIPARFYYQFRLHQYPEREWLNFVYPHQLPHWHLLQSPHVSERSLTLLQDKDQFRRLMVDNDIPAIETICQIDNTTIDFSVLFQQRPLFLKPLRGSAKTGCAALLYNKTYALIGPNAEPVENKTEQIAIFRQLGASKPYIVQPLLICDLAVMHWLGLNDMAMPLPVIRLITHRDSLNNITPHSAVLEINLHICTNGQSPLPLNPFNGMPRPNITAQIKTKPYSGFSIDPNRTTLTIPQKPFPLWSQVLAISTRAHHLFPDISTIAWDIAPVNTGLRIIEGNFNWGTSRWHQPLWQGLEFQKHVA